MALHFWLDHAQAGKKASKISAPIVEPPPSLFKFSQAEAGDRVLLCGGESEAPAHPYLAHAWAERGADLRVQAPGQAGKS